MTEHARLKALFRSQQWAIMPDALQAMIEILECVDSFDVDRSSFHGASADEWSALTDGFGARLDGTIYTRIAGRVGLLEINGPLVPRATFFSDASGLTSTAVLAAEFDLLEESPDIEQIVLLIDSPGGAVSGISEFAQLIKSSSTPTIAFVGGLAASAAYWIASAADAVASVDTGIVGSIGTIMTVYADDDENVVEIVSSQSPLKNASVKTDEGMLELQTLVDDLAQVFIDAVAENRGVTPDAVIQRFGRGGVMVAGRGAGVGMIDKIGTLRGVLGGETVERLAIESKNGEPVTITGANTADGVENEEISPRSELTIAGENCTNDHGFEKTNEEEDREMATLTDLRAENPEINEEIEQLEAAAAAAVVARAEKALPILASGDYPKSIKDLAGGYVRGEVSGDKLDGAIAGYDTAREAAIESIAADESDAIQPTPAIKTEGKRADGVVHDEASLAHAVAEFKIMRGGA